MNQRELFYRHVAQTSPFPLALEIDKAEGSYLFSKDGKQYLDLISGIAVSNVGHRHPAVLDAIQAQLHKYLHLMVYGELIQGPQVELASLLSAELLWKDQTSVYFVNSGTEATEGAIKLAKRYTGKTNLVSCYNAYHGSTNGSLSLMGNETYKQDFRPLLPGITHIRFGHLGDLELITESCAAIIIEPVQGEAGIRMADKNYFEALMQRCKQTGTLIIADEIQSGFGRTGTFFAAPQFGLVPDVVLMAKGMGGGMPIGAFAASKELMQALSHDPILGHITTFGGHPVSCAAAIACVKVLKEGQWISQAAVKGNYLKSNLKHSAIRELRGIGLMLALELDSFEHVQKVIQECMLNGVFTDWFLFCDQALRIAPPLTITTQELDEAIAVIHAALVKVYGRQ